METTQRYENWKLIMAALHNAVKTGDKESYMSNYDRLELFLEENDPDQFTPEQAEMIGRGFKLAAITLIAFESGVFSAVAGGNLA